MSARTDYELQGGAPIGALGRSGWLAVAFVAYLATWEIRLVLLATLSGDALGFGAFVDAALEPIVEYGHIALLAGIVALGIATAIGTRRSLRAPTAGRRALRTIGIAAVVTLLAGFADAVGPVAWRLSGEDVRAALAAASVLGWLCLFLAPSRTEAAHACGLHQARLAVLCNDSLMLGFRPRPPSLSSRRMMIAGSILVLLATPAPSVPRVAMVAGVLAAALIGRGRQTLSARGPGSPPSLYVARPRAGY